MDGLKSLKDKLKSETKDLNSGKRYFSRGELEARRLEKLREEEAIENERKKRRIDEKNQTLDISIEQSLLKEVEPENVSAKEPTSITFPTEANLPVVAPIKDVKQPTKPADSEEEESDPLMVAFKKAATLVAEKRKEECLTVPQKITFYLRKWIKDWEAELERRSVEEKASVSGVQALRVYKETLSNFNMLFSRLKKADSLPEDIVSGLWEMVESMKERNYLHANDVYLRLAIGNAPWPIGVTSVGIHERSAREKISHVMNAQGQAHIMNDEATRKYLQAMKRMITTLQRLYPTDPSKSSNYDARYALSKDISTDVLRICSS